MSYLSFESEIQQEVYKHCEDDHYRRCQHEAEPRYIGREHYFIYLGLAYNKAFKENSAYQSKGNADYGGNGVLTVNVCSHLAVKKAQHLYGGKLPYSLVDVNVCQVEEYYKSKRSRKIMMTRTIRSRLDTSVLNVPVPSYIKDDEIIPSQEISSEVILSLSDFRECPLCLSG